MFSNLNFWEFGALILLALFIFGPERLPKVISDGVRFLRNVRTMARNATNDLSRELGTEVRLEDLHPKAFIRKHLLSEEEEAQLRRPFEDAYHDVRGQVGGLTGDVRGIADDVNDATGRPRSELPSGAGYSDDEYGRRYDQVRPYDSQYRPAHRDDKRPYDDDAT